MIGLFKKKTKKEKLQKKYEKLMGEAHKYSQTNRKLGDEKYHEADLVLKEIEKID